VPLLPVLPLPTLPLPPLPLPLPDGARELPPDDGTVEPPSEQASAKHATVATIVHPSFFMSDLHIPFDEEEEQGAYRPENP
jgi:hypothetical protein